MNSQLARTVFTGLLAITLMGCSRMTSSGIPKALKANILLQTAGNSQGITLSLIAGSEGISDTVETESRFLVNISSGTSGQLLAAYQKEVERTITGLGGKIHGNSTTKTGDDVRDFSFNYHWDENDGIVKVYSLTGTGGDIQVILFCYEHRR